MTMTRSNCYRRRLEEVTSANEYHDESMTQMLLVKMRDSFVHQRRASKGNLQCYLWLTPYEPQRGADDDGLPVQVEWEKIEPEVCQNLIESMPKRVAAVMK